MIQFLFSPTIGSLSDHFGHRPVLLISLVIIAVDFIVRGLAHSIWLLVIIGGIAAATQATAANFSILGATFGIGFVVGPLMGEPLGEVGLRMPFFAAAALATLKLVLGYFVLPETVTEHTRRPFNIKRANPLGALTQIRLIPGLSQFLLVFFLYEFAFYVYPVSRGLGLLRQRAIWLGFGHAWRVSRLLWILDFRG